MRSYPKTTSGYGTDDDAKSEVTQTRCFIIDAIVNCWNEINLAVDVSAGIILRTACLIQVKLQSFEGQCTAEEVA